MPICLSLMFCLFVLALALAEQSRTHLGFTLSVEAEIREREAALAAMGDLSSILQRACDPVMWSNDLSPAFMKLPDPLPAALGSAELPFENGPDIDIEIDGQFGGGSDEASLYRLPPLQYDAEESDAYPSPLVTRSGIAVPARHAALYVQARIPGGGLTRWLGMISTNHPVGMMAPLGSVTLGDARSSSSWTREAESGLMASIYASSGISVKGVVNARLCVPPGQTPDAPRGIVKEVSGLTIPADFEMSRMKAAAEASKNLVDKGADIEALRQCRHASIPDSTNITALCQSGDVVAQFNPGSPDVSTIDGLPGTDRLDFIDRPPGTESPAPSPTPDTSDPSLPSPRGPSGPVFQVASADFVVPAGEHIYIPYDMDVQGSLILEKQSILHVQRTLSVHGDVRLGPQCTLKAGETVVVDGFVDMLYQPGPNPSITTSIISGADMILNRGMTNREGGMSLSSSTPFTTPDCPFSPSTLTCIVRGIPPSVHIEQVDNPNCDTFTKQAKQCTQSANAAWSRFFPAVSLPGPQTRNDVMGIFIDCGDRLRIGSGQDDVAGGLIAAARDVTLDIGRFTGVAWSRSGSITGKHTSWWWFPYWSHAWVQGASGAQAVVANRWWLTGYGQVR